MWDASSFRVVWFVRKPSHVDASRVYRELIKQEPDRTETNRIVTQDNQFSSRSQGIVDGIRNEIRVGVGRVDWLTSIHFEADESQFERLLPTEWWLDRIQRATSGIEADVLGKVTRLSVISTLLNPVGTMGEAIQSLVEICRVPLEPDGLLDFLFQANRRKKVAGEVEINRIGVFSAVTSQSVMVSINERQVLTYPDNNISYAVQAMFDFNTVPIETEFSIEEQRQIFGELLRETAIASDPTIDMFALQVPS